MSPADTCWLDDFLDYVNATLPGVRQSDHLGRSFMSKEDLHDVAESSKSNNMMENNNMENNNMENDDDDDDDGNKKKPRCHSHRLRNQYDRSVAGRWAVACVPAGPQLPTFKKDNNGNHNNNDDNINNDHENNKCFGAEGPFFTSVN